jgi:hypothetical protein
MAKRTTLRTKTRLRDFVIFKDPRWKSDWRYKVQPMLEDGMLYTEICSKLNISLCTLHKFLVQQGVVSASIKRNWHTQVFERVSTVYKKSRK